MPPTPITDPDEIAELEKAFAAPSPTRVTDPAEIAEIESAFAAQPKRVTDPTEIAELESAFAAQNQPTQPDDRRQRMTAARKDFLDTLELGGLGQGFRSAVASQPLALIKEDGKWKTPVMGSAAPKDAGILERIGSGAALLAKSAMGKMGARTDEYSDTVDRIQKQYGLSDEDVMSMGADLRTMFGDWKENEKTRTTSEGSVVFNPDARELLDTETTRVLVAGSGASPEGQAAFLASLPERQRNIASNKLEAYEAAAAAARTMTATPAGLAVSAADGRLQTPSEYARQKGVPADQWNSPEFISEYETEVLDKQGSAGAFIRGLTVDALLGWNKLATTGLGVAGMVGSEGAAEMAAAGSEVGSVVGQGKADTGLTGAVVQEAPSILGQVVGTRLLGPLAALAGRGSSAANTAATLGMAGAQSAGMTYADARASGATHEEAQKNALMSGVNTAVITGVFSKLGLGGVEDVAAGKPAQATIRDILRAGSKQELWQGVRGYARDVVGGALGEGAEEGLDTLTQTFLTADPDTNIFDAWEQALESAKVGAVIGGGVGVASTLTGPERALVTPENAAIAPETAAAVRDTAPAELELPTPDAPTDPNAIPMSSGLDFTNAPLTAQAAGTEVSPTQGTPTDSLPDGQVPSLGSAAPTPSPTLTPTPDEPNIQGPTGSEIPAQAPLPMREVPTGETAQPEEAGGRPDTASQETTAPVEGLDREQLKSVFNLTDEQADAAQLQSRALGLTPEQVILEREFTKEMGRKPKKVKPVPESATPKSEETRSKLGEAPVKETPKTDTRPEEPVKETAESLTQPTLFDTPRQRSLASMRAEVVRKLADPDIDPVKEDRLVALLGRIERTISQPTSTTDENNRTTGTRTTGRSNDSESRLGRIPSISEEIPLRNDVGDVSPRSAVARGTTEGNRPADTDGIRDVGIEGSLDDAPLQDVGGRGEQTPNPETLTPTQFRSYERENQQRRDDLVASGSRAARVFYQRDIEGEVTEQLSGWRTNKVKPSRAIRIYTNKSTIEREPSRVLKAEVAKVAKKSGKAALLVQETDDAGVPLAWYIVESPAASAMSVEFPSDLDRGNFSVLHSEGVKGPIAPPPSRDHRDILERGGEDRKNLSAEAVDTYGIELPTGYVREGDLYVYRPTTTAPTVAEQETGTPTDAAEPILPAELASDVGTTEAPTDGATRYEEALNAGLDKRSAGTLGAAADLANMIREVRGQDKEQRTESLIELYDEQLTRFPKGYTPHGSLFGQFIPGDDQTVEIRRNSKGGVEVVAGDVSWTPQGETPPKPVHKKGKVLKSYPSVKAFVEDAYKDDLAARDTAPTVAEQETGTPTDAAEPILPAEAEADIEYVNTEIRAKAPSQSPDMMQAFARIGAAIDPDLRLSDQQTMGQVYAMVRRGEMTEEAFIKYLNETRSQFESLRNVTSGFEERVRRRVRGDVEKPAPQTKGQKPAEKGETDRGGAMRGTEVPQLRTIPRGSDRAGATAAGQTVAANRAGRVSLLLRLNEMTGNPFDEGELRLIEDSQIDSIRDWLVERNNARLTTPESERFQSPTSQTDADYLAAINRGDMETAQAMVEQAAREAGYNVGPVYHGTPNKEPFTMFEETTGDTGFFFATREEDAAGYGSRVIPAFLRMDNNYRVTEAEFEAGGLSAMQAKEQGYDSFTMDYGKGDLNHAVFNPNQIKSADTVVRDDAGNIIPLSQRFNPASPDIRFQKRPQGAKGSAQLTPDKKVLIKAFESADFTTITHEMMHAFEMTEYGDLTDAEVATLKAWAGSKTEGRSMMETRASEKLARGWEKYIATGKAPIQALQELFDKMSKWMLDVYGQITGSDIDVDISAEVQQIFDKIALRMENPSVVYAPTGATLETSDGTPLPPAIPFNPEEITDDLSPEEATEKLVGMLRGVMENPPAIPEPEAPTQPEDWNPEGLYSLQERRAKEEADKYGIPYDEWKQAARSFPEVWQETMDAGPNAAADTIARLKRDPAAVLTDRDVAILTIEGMRLKSSLDRAIEGMQTNEAVASKEEMASREAIYNNAFAAYQELQNIAAGARTASGRALNAWKLALRDDFSVATLQSTHLTRYNAARVRSGKPPVTTLPREEIQKIIAFSEKMLDMQARMRELRELPESERANYEARIKEQEDMINALIEERKSTLKKTAVTDLTKRLIVSRVQKAAADAEARLRAAGLIDPTIRYQSPTPQNDPRWYDRVLVLAAPVVINPAMTTAQFADYVLKKFGQGYAAVADALRKDVDKHLKTTLSDITGSHVPTPDEVMEGAPEEVTRELVFEVARAHVYEGAKYNEVMDRTHTTLADTYEGITRDQVSQLFTDYGKQRRESASPLVKALATAKTLELIQKQIDDLVARGQMLKTGKLRGEIDAEILKKRKERDDLAKKLDYVPVDPETGLSSAQGAARKRMEHEIRELETAISSGVARIRVRRGVKYTAEMEEMRTKLEGLRKDYENAFGQERTPAERSALILKSLDRQIAREQKLIEDGLLKSDSTLPPLVDTPEILERREYLKQLREEKFAMWDAAHPNERALGQAMKEAEAAVKRREDILQNGLRETPARRQRGEGVDPTEALNALWQAADAMDVLIREMRRNRPLTPAQEQARLDAAYDSAIQTRDALQQKIASGDLSVAPKTAREVELRTQAIRRESATLRKQLTQMQKDAGIGPFSQEAKESRKVAILQQKLFELRRRRVEQDYAQKARPEPVTSEQIRTLDAIIESEKMDFESERAAWVYDQLGRPAKFKSRILALYQARMMFNLTGDFGVWDRQLGKVNTLLVLNDLKNIGKALVSGEKPDISATTVGKMMSKAFSAFMEQGKQVEIYRYYATHPMYPFLKANGFQLANPHETSFELSGDGEVRINPMTVINDVTIAGLMLAKGIVKTSVGMMTGGLVPGLISSGVRDTIMSTALALGGRRYAIRVERAQQTMLNVARWETAMLALNMYGSVDPKVNPRYAQDVMSAVMSMTGRIGGTGGVAQKARANAYILSHIVSYAAYRISNFETITLNPLRRLIGRGDTGKAAAVVSTMYGSWLAGTAMKMTVAAMVFGMLFDDEDDDEGNAIGLVTNWRNPRFGQVKVGPKTYIDFASGARVWTTDLIGMFGDETLDREMLAEGVEIAKLHTARDKAQARLRFFDKVTNPNLATLRQFFMDREFREGGPLERQSALSQLDRINDEILMNLTAKEFDKIMEEHGPVEGAKIFALLMMGNNVTIREDTAARAERKAEEALRLTKPPRTLSPE